MNDINIKISIVTVVYNSVSTLEQTIKSVLSQNYENLEYIIIDGGSTDGSVDIIKKYQNQIHYWVSESDKGIYDAMNKGITVASGDLIGIINSDDWYEPNVFNSVTAAYNNLGRDDNVIFYGFLKLWKNGKEHTIRRFHHNFGDEQMFQHPTWFVPRKVYDRFGVFNSELRVAGDFDLLQRFRIGKVNFSPLDNIVSNFRIGGISSYGAKIAKKEYLNLRFKYGLMPKKEYYKNLIKMNIKRILTF